MADNLNYNQIGNNQPEKVTIFRRLQRIGQSFGKAFIVGERFLSGSGFTRKELKEYKSEEAPKQQTINVPMRRGAVKGQKYSNPTPNKYIYRRGYGNKPRKIGLNPRWVAMYGNDAGLRKSDAGYRRISPSSRRFSRVARQLTSAVLPQAQDIYAFPEYNVPEGQLTFEQAQQLAEEELYSYPRRLSGYELKLLKSNQFYKSRQLRRQNDLDKAKNIRLLQDQIRMQSQILNAPSSVKVPENERINIYENIYSVDNPNYLNLMKQRMDSINILKTGRPSLLNAESIMNSSTNILHAPKLNFGLIDPTKEQI